MPSSTVSLAITILEDDRGDSEAFTLHVDSMTDVELVELKQCVVAPDLVGHIMSQAIMESTDTALGEEDIERTLRTVERLLKAGFSPFDPGGNDASHAGGRVIEGLIEMEDQDTLEPRTVDVAIRCIKLLIEHGVSLEAPTTPGGAIAWHDEIAEFPGLAGWVASHKAGQLEAAWPQSVTASRGPRM